MRSWKSRPKPADEMERLKNSFGRVGWFIPAFVATGQLEVFAKILDQAAGGAEHDRLADVLAAIHTPNRMAAMTLHRYPVTPIVQEFSETISEALQAHFIGLHHVAIGGLIPVIEGVGKRFAAERSLPPTRSPSKFFKLLMDDCKREASEKDIGIPSELAFMMDSFSIFTTDHLYTDSTAYKFADRTNRNGIAHGAYTDSDFGTPLNFYKAMSALDFLTFVSIFKHRGSVFVPEFTNECATFLACVGAQGVLRERLVSPLSAAPGKPPPVVNRGPT